MGQARSMDADEDVGLCVHRLHLLLEAHLFQSHCCKLACRDNPLSLSLPEAVCGKGEKPRPESALSSALMISASF